MRTLLTILIWLVLAATPMVALRPSRAATSYAAMTGELRRDCAARQGALHLYAIGSAARTGHPIWMVRVSDPASRIPIAKGERVLLICRQHGDEPVSTEAALKLLRDFSTMAPADLAATLGSVTLYIVPMANPDGADALTRVNGVGADLNRDWGRFTQPETRALYAASKMIQPQLVVDFHSWTPDDPFQNNSIETGDSGSGVNRQAVQVSLALQSELVAAIRGNCRQSASEITYPRATDATLCHRFFAQDRGIASLLIETAPSSDNPATMLARIAYDNAVFHCLIDQMRMHQDVWQRLANAEGTSAPPASPYVHSVSELNGSAKRLRRAMASARAAAIAIHKKEEARERKAVRWVIGIYIVSVLVLVRRLARPIAAAMAALRGTQAGPAAPTGPSGYVSVRRRRYPVVPKTDPRPAP